MLLDLHTDFSRGRSGGLVFLYLKGFSTVCCIHTVKDFGVVNKAEIHVSLELSCNFKLVKNLQSSQIKKGVKIARFLLTKMDVKNDPKQIQIILQNNERNSTSLKNEILKFFELCSVSALRGKYSIFFYHVKKKIKKCVYTLVALSTLTFF